MAGDDRSSTVQLGRSGPSGSSGPGGPGSATWPNEITNKRETFPKGVGNYGPTAVEKSLLTELHARLVGRSRMLVYLMSLDLERAFDSEVAYQDSRKAEDGSKVG